MRVLNWILRAILYIPIGIFFAFRHGVSKKLNTRQYRLELEEKKRWEAENAKQVEDIPTLNCQEPIDQYTYIGDWKMHFACSDCERPCSQVAEFCSGCGSAPSAYRVFINTYRVVYRDVVLRGNVKKREFKR